MRVSNTPSRSTSLPLPRSRSQPAQQPECSCLDPARGLYERTRRTSNLTQHERSWAALPPALQPAAVGASWNSGPAPFGFRAEAAAWHKASRATSPPFGPGHRPPSPVHKAAAEQRSAAAPRAAACPPVRHANCRGSPLLLPHPQALAPFPPHPPPLAADLPPAPMFLGISHVALLCHLPRESGTQRPASLPHDGLYN